MSLTLRSAALFYIGVTENIGYGDIVPPLDGIEATGHSTIMGDGNFVTLIEEIVSTGDSYLAEGRMTGLLPEVNGAGLSEYGLFGDMVIAPRRDIVHLEGSLPFSFGRIDQLQEISGFGTSQAIVGLGRIKHHKCIVTSAGNSDYVACKGPGVYVPPAERIQGTGFTGTFIGVGDIRDKRHVVSGIGASNWTLSISGSGSVGPNIDTVEGVGTSGYTAGINATGAVTGLRHVVSGKGYFPVTGAGSVTQTTAVKATGSVQSNIGPIEFSRDQVASAPIPPAVDLPLGHNRPGTSTAGGQSPVGNPALLEFSR